jgi:hypothetical protein
VNIHASQARLVNRDGTATAYFWKVLLSLMPSGPTPRSALVLVDKDGTATPMFQKMLDAIADGVAIVPISQAQLIDIRTGSATPVFQKFLGAIA